ncbi:hypothetical protein VTK73DRAFT_3804 [Phialemonium thermophilum]|uniref:ABC transmembrane type-1 domain-containing protein n=1 Tax=Phialemonium thermophilum TaxID=223376 RepID=A0ABR3VET3_9PEZI
MEGDRLVPDALPAVLLAVAAMLTLPPLASLLRRRPASTPNRPYQDEDGVSSADEEASMSDGVPRAGVLLGAVAGFWASTTSGSAAAIQPSASANVPRATAGLWGLICLQGLAILVEPRAHKRFRYGIATAVCVACVACVLATTAVSRQMGPGAPCSRRGGAERAACASTLLASLSLRRRPTVFFRGQRVDQEHGVSLLARCSFSWIAPVFRLARARPLGLPDLPAVGHRRRARTLRQSLAAQQRSQRLWRQLVGVFAPTIVRHWVLVLLAALCGVGSRAALYQLLRCLEPAQRRPDEDLPSGDTTRAALAWVAVLGLSLAARSVLDTRLSWLSETRLQMPVIATLKALVFDKSTRIPISHGAAAPSGDQRQPRQTGKEARGGAGPSLTSLMTNDWYGDALDPIRVSTKSGELTLAFAAPWYPWRAVPATRFRVRCSASCSAASPWCA